MIVIDSKKESDVKRLMKDSIENAPKPVQPIIPAIGNDLSPHVILHKLKMLESKNKEIETKSSENVKKQTHSYTYTYTGEAKIRELLSLYDQHGDTKDILFYCSKTRVKQNTMYKYLKKLKEGTFTVDKPLHKGGRNLK